MTPTPDTEEKAWAVRLMHNLEIFQDILTAGPIRRAVRHLLSRPVWPSAPGAYMVGDASAPVAVCTLTSEDLIAPLSILPGVAISGRVYTANLGIEKIVQNITDNPYIRFLLVCGKDSPLFHPGQTLRALWVHGVLPDHRVISSRGYLPVLSNLKTASIDCFRSQIELVDCLGETDIEVLKKQIQALVERNPGPYPDRCDETEAGAFAVDRAGDDQRFLPVRPGGRREPLAYDPKGFFVITVDRKSGEIILRHYLPDNTPAHIMRGRYTETILLGLVREKLISQMSHAGYLGAELAKAETALRLGLRYEQDQPLRPYG